MFKHVNLQHEVDPDLGENEVHVEKIGANSYRVRTGDPGKYEFSKFEERRKRFDEKFVEKFNEVAEHNDRFELDHRDSRDSLDRLRNNIKDGNSSFDLKVRE